MSEGSKSQQRTHWGVWTLDTNGEVAFNDVFIMNIDILTLNNIEGFIAFYSCRSRVWMTLKLHITYYTSIEMSVLGKRAVQEIGKQWKVYKKAFWPLVLYPHSVILSNIIPWSSFARLHAKRFMNGMDFQWIYADKKWIKESAFEFFNYHYFYESCMKNQCLKKTTNNSDFHEEYSNLNMKKIMLFC